MNTYKNINTGHYVLASNMTISHKVKLKYYISFQNIWWMICHYLNIFWYRLHLYRNPVGRGLVEQSKCINHIFIQNLVLDNHLDMLRFYHHSGFSTYIWKISFYLCLLALLTSCLIDRYNLGQIVDLQQVSSLCRPQ